MNKAINKIKKDLDNNHVDEAVEAELHNNPLPLLDEEG